MAAGDQQQRPLLHVDCWGVRLYSESKPAASAVICDRTLVSGHCAVSDGILSCSVVKDTRVLAVLGRAGVDASTVLDTNSSSNCTHMI
jgi:hypothetical protein